MTTLCRAAFTSLFLLMSASAMLDAQDRGLPLDVPQKADTRHQIDALIKQCRTEKKKLTLGLLCETIDLSVGYGAPAWNLGNHDACANFYIDTANALAGAFPDPSAATPEAWAALADMKSALARTSNSSGSDQNAWAMRFAFDKTELSAEAECDHAAGLLALGSQYLKRSNLNEAQDAFTAAVGILDEMGGRTAERIPIACRVAPFALANVLLAQRKYHEASGAITKGLALFPEWAAVNEDLRGIYGDPTVAAGIVQDLEQSVANDPNDPTLAFLLGYEYHFMGQKAEAKKLFEKALELNPGHAEAKAFLNPPPLPKPAPESPRSVPSSPFSQTS